MRPRTLIIVLCASLAANVFLVGAVAGGWAMRRTAAQAPAAQRGSLLRQASAALEPDSRMVFRHALRAAALDAAPVAAQARASRLETADLIAAPVFDPVAANAALDRARASDMEVRTRLERAAVTAIAALSPSERATLSDAMRRKVMQNRAPRQAPAPANR
jgi:uncharacterized membrane protein